MNLILARFVENIRENQDYGEDIARAFEKFCREQGLVAKNGRNQETVPDNSFDLFFQDFQDMLKREQRKL